MNDALRLAVLKMAHSQIRHYIAPGLASYLVGGDGHGKVRLFQADRETREWIAPHSHRFDFTCLVLQGFATNIILTRAWGAEECDRYCASMLKRKPDTFGEYEFIPGDSASEYREEAKTYHVGDTYSMTHDQIHSIRFSRDALVLFFEGPEVTDESIVLEPWSDNQRVPTFATQPWMFERESAIPTTGDLDG